MGSFINLLSVCQRYSLVPSFFLCAAAEVVASEEWEEELAKELEDLGLQVGVDEGEEEGEGTGLEGDEHWEDELKLMLESHSTDT